MWLSRKKQEITIKYLYYFHDVSKVILLSVDNFYMLRNKKRLYKEGRKCWPVSQECVLGNKLLYIVSTTQYVGLNI
jgi:hypothetical protein